MQYQKATQLLAHTNQEGFEYFLTLNAQQIGQLMQFLSEEDQTRIFAFLKKNNHVPLKPNSETKPPFVDSIKALYKRLYFNEKPAQRQSDPENLQPKQDEQSQWFRHLFQRQNQKQKTKETKFNFPYFSVVKRLMTAHDNEPDEQSVKVMHSELEILMKRIFCSKFMDGMKRMLGVNKDMYVIPREQTQKNLTVNNIKTYLSKLFEKQYTNFKAFKNQYQQIKKDVEVQPSDNEATSEEEKGQNLKQLYEVADTNQETEYYLSKTKQMNNEQLFKFYRAREANFMKQGSEKLIAFTRLNSVLTQVKNRQLLEMLSYVLCMTVRRVIFTRIRQLYNGKLFPQSSSISSQVVQRIGNQYIETVQKKAKTYCLKFEMFMKKAFQLFREEFYSQGYDVIFLSDTKIRLVRQQQEIVSKNEQEKVAQVWRKNKDFRKDWYDRVVAQQQIKQHNESQEQHFKPVNEYAQYLHENKNIVKSVGHRKLFKNYIFGALNEPKTQTRETKPSKRLQSLFK